MCEFCGQSACKLTKTEVVKRGAILEDNAYSIMRLAGEENPQTYSFEDVPAYYSWSALIPDESEDDPHMFMRFIFDEDEGLGGEWECREIQNPMNFQTEKEFLERFNSKN